ncbi:hypothetical protein PG988_016135 [Apiospora saccharicola]
MSQYDGSRIYGLREVSDALDNSKYHGASFHGDGDGGLNDIMARRPTALRYASAYLSDETNDLADRLRDGKRKVGHEVMEGMPHAFDKTCQPGRPE